MEETWLNEGEFKLLEIIKEWRGDAKFKQNIFPSEAYLRKRLDKSQRTVYRVLASLKKKKGWD